jgi:hypothetical protein
MNKNETCECQLEIECCLSFDGEGRARDALFVRLTLLERVLFICRRVCSEAFFHFLFPSLEIGSPTSSAIMKIILRLLLMCYVKQRTIDRYSWVPINRFEKLSTVLSKYTYGQSHNAASICVLGFSITYSRLAQDPSGQLVGCRVTKQFRYSDRGANETQRRKVQFSHFLFSVAFNASEFTKCMERRKNLMSFVCI